MKKLLLKLDDLRVETFATHDAVPARGTVAGLESGEETEGATCLGTCAPWTKCGDCTWTGPIETDDCTGYQCTYNCPVSAAPC